MRTTHPVWIPTHKILYRAGKMRLVCLLADATGAGPGYTREAWDARLPADYARTADGRWTFCGQLFVGIVSRIKAKSGSCQLWAVPAESRQKQSSKDLT